MTDIPTNTQEEAVEVRTRLCALLLDRDGADFDGEVHLTSAEAREVIAALSPNMDHAVGGLMPNPAAAELLAQQEWQEFLDANPSDLTSPEEYPDHALVSFDEFILMVQAIIIGSQPLPEMGRPDAPLAATKAIIEDWITKTTEDGVWPAHVHGAWQIILAALAVESFARPTDPSPETWVEWTPPVNQDAVREALERIDDFVRKFREPWGSWKTSWWEGEVSDDAAFSTDNALMHIANLARKALATPSLDNTGLDAAKGWQPIETAPKDGTVVIVWGYDEDEVEEAEDEGRQPVAYPFPAMVSVQKHIWWHASGLRQIKRPSHWRPIEAGPQSARGQS